MNAKSITQSNNPVLAGSLSALRRSAKRAQQIAEQTGTRLIVAQKADSSAKRKPRNTRGR
ncbi:MAG: hypothetical protein ACREP2_01930 [Rhodanobacteraceae bacterium]